MKFDNNYRGSGWVVYSPVKDKPTMVHATRHDAITEAERLCQLYPGIRFHVLQINGYCEGVVNYSTNMFV